MKRNRYLIQEQIVNVSLNKILSPFSKKCLSFPLSILKRPLPIITSISDEILGFACLSFKNKQQLFIVFLLVKNKQRQTKKLPQLNWTSSGQAATKTERNEFLLLINFPEFSETFAILRNIECSRKSSENPSCSLTPISLNLSPLNHFQTL